MIYTQMVMTKNFFFVCLFSAAYFEQKYMGQIDPSHNRNRQATTEVFCVHQESSQHKSYIQFLNKKGGVKWHKY